jgi:hypothetical protein
LNQFTPDQDSKKRILKRNRGSMSTVKKSGTTLGGCSKLKVSINEDSLNFGSDSTIKNNSALPLTTRNNNKNRKNYNTLKKNFNVGVGNFSDQIEAFASPDKHLKKDISEPVNKRWKKYDPSKNYYHVDDLASLMKKIKDAPKYMVDYKTNLETSMFRKKFGLEKIDDFQKILHYADIQKDEKTENKLPKLREKSFDIKEKSSTRETVILEEESQISRGHFLNQDLVAPEIAQKKLRFKSLNQSKQLSR